MINVLVVEDEPPIQRMICKTISEMDREFSVRYTAFNGIQAQRILEAEEVDVVFTDIMMIGGDGITLLQYLHVSSEDGKQKAGMFQESAGRK